MLSELDVKMLKNIVNHEDGTGTIPPGLLDDQLALLLLKLNEMPYLPPSDVAGCVTCEGECQGFRLACRPCAIRRCSGGSVFS